MDLKTKEMGFLTCNWSAVDGRLLDLEAESKKRQPRPQNKSLDTGSSRFGSGRFGGELLRHAY